MQWKLLNKEILLDDGLSINKPDALTIFKAEFKGLTNFSGSILKKPSDELEGLNFIKIPLDIKLQLYTENIEIHFRTIAFLNELEYKIDIKSLLHDYIIIENKWFPLLPGKKEDIKALLHQYDINSEAITLRQALELKKSANSLEIIIEENIKKEVLISDTINESSLFTATLYQYQKEGYRWMNFMVDNQLGFVLADEMGLGKSIQIIRLICQRIDYDKKPFLIVAPASLLENWKREFNKFTSGVNVHIHQGQDRSGSPTYLKSYDVIVTSYETLNSDLSIFKMIFWDMVIADEAQSIKNPDAQRTKAIKGIGKKFSIAVTGTPFENKLTDVWSIVDFIYPNYLPSKNEFEQKFKNDIAGAEEIEPLISPIILRRRIGEVAKDLPEKIFIDQAILMDETMINEYEYIRHNTQQNLSSANMLASLIKLRMFCCDPSLSSESSFEYKNNKLERLINIVEEIAASNEKCIIFTSFQKMADIIQKEIVNHFGMYCTKIDGRTPISERQKIIDEYSDKINSAALVLNPKAAGTGLNITAANHVIHFNSEWNPAVEDQATARAYRKGQNKPVRIYKLFYVDTIDEVIQDRLLSKRIISEKAIVGVQGESLSFNEILNALNVTPKR